MVMRPVDVSREEMVGRCALDRIYMGHFCFPRDFRVQSAESHYVLNSLLNSNEEFIAVMCHRGWAKSTLLCMIDPLHQIAYCPPDDTRFIPIISETQIQSMNHVARVSDAVQYNRRYRWLFGDKYKGSRRWGMKEIVTNNGVRICAAGTGQRLRGLIDVGGRRPTRTLVDDCESRKNGATPAMRRENMKWLYAEVLPFRDHVIGQVVVLQSPIAHDSIIYRLMSDPTWVTLRVPLYEGDIDTGQIAWAEMWDWKKIKAERELYRSQGWMGLFDQEYLLIPYKDEGVGINKDDIRWYTGDYKVDEFGVKYIEDFTEVNEDGVPIGETRDKVITCFAACDPAIGQEKRHDFTAYIAGGMDSKENYYVVTPRRFRSGSAYYIGNEFSQFAHEHSVDGIGIETVSFQAAIGEVVDQWCVDNKVEFDYIRRFNPRSSKKSDLRLGGLMNKFKARKMFLKREHKELLNEILEYPSGEHDDYLDALWMMTKCAYPPSETDPGRALSTGMSAVDRFLASIPSGRVV